MVKYMRWHNIILIGLSITLLNCCSNKKDFDNIVASEWEKCNNKEECIVNLAVLMDFKWDTMFYFSSAYSLEEINKELGFKLEKFTDIGDRVLFINKGKIVYQKEWFPNADKPVEGVVFMLNDDKFKINRSKAKFKVKKEGCVYYLKPLF